MSILNKMATVCIVGDKMTGYLVPILDLGLRFWVAKVFFMSGLTKIQSWNTTVMLFEYEYNVPFMSPIMAAYTGTIAELVLPVLLLLGFLGRPAAVALFVFNAIAVYAYGSFLFGEDGGAGLQQHIMWGVMLMVTFIHGPGKLSVDAYIMKKFG